MKYFIKITCMALLAFSQLSAQDSLKKRQFGIDLAFAKPNGYKNGVSPSLTFSWNKQVVFAGLASVQYDEDHSRPLLGAQAGYRIFPNGRNKRFNLFFEYDLVFVKGDITDKLDFRTFEVPFGQGTRTMHLVSLDNYFGFGFRWNISKNFYLSSNIGLGLGLYKEDYSYKYSSGETWSGTGSLALRDPLNNFNRVFKIGIGYDLVSFKKNR